MWPCIPRPSPPEPDHSIESMRTTSPSNATPGFGSPTRAIGICTSLMRSQIVPADWATPMYRSNRRRIMHSPTRDPMPLMEKPTYLFRVNHEVRWGISKPAATGALGSGWNRALAKWPVSRRHLSQNSGRPPPADVLLWTLADLVIEPKSRLCADSVAKVFLSHRSQIFRAVGAAIEY